MDKSELCGLLGLHLSTRQTGAASVELDSLGNENALGFSLSFDPAVLTFTEAVLGTGATGATLNVNSNQTRNGRLGFALALALPHTFAQGTRSLVEVSFTALPAGAGSSTAINFGDQPIGREIGDPSANALTASYVNGSVIILNTVARPGRASC